MRFLESDARSVSISDVDAFLNEVGSTPRNGHHAARRRGPKSAMRRHGARISHARTGRNVRLVRSANSGQGASPIWGGFGGWHYNLLRRRPASAWTVPPT